VHICCRRLDIFSEGSIRVDAKLGKAVTEQLFRRVYNKSRFRSFMLISAVTRSPSFRPLTLFSNFFAITPREFMPWDHRQFISRIPALYMLQSVPQIPVYLILMSIHSRWTSGTGTSLTLITPGFSKNYRFHLNSHAITPYK